MNVDEQMDQFLEISLSKIKDILNTNEEQALIELNFFLNSALNKYSNLLYEIQSFEDEDDDYIYELKDFMNTFKTLRNNFKINNVNYYDIKTLNSLKFEITTLLDSNYIKKYYQKFIDLLDSIEKIENNFKKSWALSSFDTNLTRHLYSLHSVRSVIKDIDEAKTYLINEHLYSNEMKEKYTKLKEKTVRFRANKKLLEMEIAEKTGNYQKTQKLRKEAQVLLEHDWREFYDNEDYPELIQNKTQNRVLWVH